MMRYQLLRQLIAGGIFIIEIMRTEAANLVDYLAVRNVVAYAGSWLTPGKLVTGGQYNEITRLTTEAIEIARGTES